MPNFREVLREAQGPGDTATILIAGTVGFVVDGALSVHGLFSPGTVGALTASGALGIKKGWEARRAAKRADKRQAKATERAKKVIALLTDSGHNPSHPGATRLQEELRLLDRGLSETASLNQAIDEVVKTYRADLAK